ncbi:hypothetical protein cypCar_00042945 [Cyprinus carpio]|nr:hypothetical protein cypCar_00042945 [Cyprinus carpio]
MDSLRRLQRKDPRQAELEILEQGFNLYINGAHVSAANAPQNSRSSRTPIQPSVAAQRNTHTADSSREKCAVDRQKQRSHTAPEKAQRRRWVQESVYICAEKGKKVKISSEHRYSDDFEPCESADMEALRRSLEVSVRRSNRDSAGEESEEEWIEEQIEREESSDSLPDLTLPAQPTSQPISKQLSHGDLIMLEFSPSSQGTCSRVERPLSAARKMQEERDSEETAAGVFQALQRENSPLQTHRQERSMAQHTPVELHLLKHK